MWSVFPFSFSSQMLPLQLLVHISSFSIFIASPFSSNIMISCFQTNWLNIGGVWASNPPNVQSFCPKTANHDVLSQTLKSAWGWKKVWHVRCEKYLIPLSDIIGRFGGSGSTKLPYTYIQYIILYMYTPYVNSYIKCTFSIKCRSKTLFYSKLDNIAAENTKMWLNSSI